MGARPDQRLVVSFLSAVSAVWERHPGVCKVEDQDIDLVPALAQMCIKALAAELRASVPATSKDNA